MSNSNRPPFQMAPRRCRRCGRTEAMLNRVVENILRFEQEWLKQIAKEPNELLRDLPFTRVRGDEKHTHITTFMPEIRWKSVPSEKEEIDGKADDSNKKNDQNRP